MKIAFILFISLALCYNWAAGSEEVVGPRTNIDQNHSKSELQNRIDLLRTERDDALLEVANIRNQYSVLEENFENLSKSASKVSVDSQFHAESNHKISALESTVHKLKGEKQQLLEEIEELKEIIKGYENKHVSCKTDTGAQSTIVQQKAFEDALRRSQAAADSHIHAAAHLEAKVADFQLHIAKLVSEKDQLLVDFRATGAALSKSQKETQVMRDRYMLAAKKLDEQLVTIKELEVHHDHCRSQALHNDKEIAVLQLKLSRSPVQRAIKGLRQFSENLRNLLRWFGVHDLFFKPTK
jgi:cell division septum initiation protein DivIVA